MVHQDSPRVTQAAHSFQYLLSSISTRTSNVSPALIAIVRSQSLKPYFCSLTLYWPGANALDCGQTPP